MDADGQPPVEIGHHISSERTNDYPHLVLLVDPGPTLKVTSGLDAKSKRKHELTAKCAAGHVSRSRTGSCEKVQ
jgi:hypothetical protein